MPEEVMKPEEKVKKRFDETKPISEEMPQAKLVGKWKLTLPTDIEFSAMGWMAGYMEKHGISTVHEEEIGTTDTTEASLRTYAMERKDLENKGYENVLKGMVESDRVVVIAGGVFGAGNNENALATAVNKVAKAIAVETNAKYEDPNAYTAELLGNEETGGEVSKRIRDEYLSALGEVCPEAFKAGIGELAGFSEELVKAAEVMEPVEEKVVEAGEVSLKEEEATLEEKVEKTVEMMDSDSYSPENLEEITKSLADPEVKEGVVATYTTLRETCQDLLDSLHKEHNRFLWFKDSAVKFSELADVPGEIKEAIRNEISYYANRMVSEEERTEENIGAVELDADRVYELLKRIRDRADAVVTNIEVKDMLAEGNVEGVANLLALKAGMFKKKFYLLFKRREVMDSEMIELLKDRLRGDQKEWMERFVFEDAPSEYRQKLKMYSELGLALRGQEIALEEAAREKLAEAETREPVV